MKVLVATEKPFAAVAVNGIKDVMAEAGYEVILLEKYPDKTALLAAVADADAMIVRSDKIDAEVFEATKRLKIVVRAGAGYANMKYDTYYNIDNGALIETKSRNYWGITRLGISLSYHF